MMPKNVLKALQVVVCVAVIGFLYWLFQQFEEFIEDSGSGSAK